MKIEDIENELIEDFSMFEDWMDKYNYIIGMGKEMEPLPDNLKTANTLVSGCTSQVWLNSEYKDGKLYFQADSDALIPKGIAAILVKMYSGYSAAEILNHTPKFIKEIGLEQHLSPNRANGLASMINKIKHVAQSIQTQNN